VARENRGRGDSAMMPEVLVLAIVILCGAHLVARHAWAIIALVLMVLPVLRDGPLDFDLGWWKLVLVIALLLCLPVRWSTLLAGSSAHTGFLIVCCLLATLVSFGLAPHRNMSLPMTQTWLTSVLFLLLCWSAYDVRLLRWSVRAVLALTTGICLVAFIQYATIRFQLDHPVLLRILSPGARAWYFEMNNPLGDEGVRLASVFFHPNQLGHVLGLCFGFVLPLFLTARRNRDRAVHCLVLSLILAGVFLTLSRGALLVVLVELLVIVMLMRKRLRLHLLAAAAAGAVVLVGIVMLLGNVTPLLTRVLQSGLSSRATLWLNGASLIPSHFLIGVGPGGSSYQMLTRFPILNNTDLLDSYYIGHAYDAWGNAPHNYYLTTMLEGGVFTLVFRILLYATVVGMGIGLIRRLRRPLLRGFAIAVTVPLGCEFVRGVFDSYDFLAAMESGGLVAFFIATIIFLDAYDRRGTAMRGARSV